MTQPAPIVIRRRDNGTRSSRFPASMPQATVEMSWDDEGRRVLWTRVGDEYTETPWQAPR